MVSLFLSSVSPLAAEAAQEKQVPIGNAALAYWTLRNPVYACDLLAAPPGDKETQAPGVRF
jgi:hypothetical protein